MLKTNSSPNKKRLSLLITTTLILTTSLTFVCLFQAGLLADVVTFTDVADAAGVGDEERGMGTAWADYDNDGDLDLFVTNLWGASVLYQNNGDGTFTDVADAAGVGDMHDNVGCAWADYDNDGDLDLFVTKYEYLVHKPNRLYQNNGDGTFTDVADAAGVADIGPHTGVAWGDYNNDGYLDIYIAKQREPNMLYQNNGDGTFTDVADAAGVGDVGVALGVAWADYNNDGDLDLYVVNRISAIGGEYDGRNMLYQNNGDGTFTDITDIAGVGDPGFGGGCAWGDYDNDGDLDLYLAIYRGVSVLYQNNSDGTFTDVAYAAGVDVSGWSMGCAWGDYDNDGYIDLYVSKEGPDRLFKNNSDGTFTDVTAIAGTDKIGNGNACAWADYDNDGDLDLYVVNYASWYGTPNNILYRNNGNPNNYISIKTIGSTSNIEGIGARITLTAGGIAQIREVSGGSGKSQDSLPVEFGLGPISTIDTIEVRWPSGETQTLNNVAANQFITIVETNTHIGTDVSVALRGGVTVIFSEVTEAGATTATMTTTAPPAGFRLVPPDTYYEITTTATYIGRVTVCINYDDTELTLEEEEELALYHLVEGMWEEITNYGYPDTTNNIICGTADTLSVFAVVVEDTVPPEISVSVTPDKLWPPNHKLTEITATVTASDNLDPNPSVSLLSITSNEPDDAEGGGDGKTVNDIQGAGVGTDDRSFLLRRERANDGSGRVYTITYIAIDASGNSTTASATVVVPRKK